MREGTQESGQFRSTKACGRVGTLGLRIGAHEMIDVMLADQDAGDAPQDELRKSPAPCRAFGPWASARSPRLFVTNL